MDESNSWRPHAAIVLANLNTPEALGTIYQLGCVLTHRGLHAAADFCFLAVSLLMPSYNPFEPLPKRCLFFYLWFFITRTFYSRCSYWNDFIKSF